MGNGHVPIVDDDLTYEELNIGGLHIRQPRKGYRFSLDAILLADFLRVKTGERVLDIGTGSGIIPLLASELTTAKDIVGLELQDRLFALACDNIRLNHLEQRVTIIQGDLCQVQTLFQAGEFDVVCSNPPYRKEGSGRVNPNDEAAIARHEIACQLPDLVAACKYAVKPGGKVYLVHLAERMGELISCMRQYNLEPKRLRFVHSFHTADASLALVEAQRDALAGLKILPPFVVYTKEKEYTDEAKRVLREA
jgi:tRNA1Val (adenine37-N6)-methyltransferase